MLLQDYYTSQFYLWEQRGRGWHWFDDPIELEPGFIPFFGHRAPKLPTAKQYAIPMFTGIADSFNQLIGRSLTPPIEPYSMDEVAERYKVQAIPVQDAAPEICELRIVLNKDTHIGKEFWEQLLLLLSQTNETLSFEIIGTHERIHIQFACNESDRYLVKGYLTDYLPGLTILENAGSLSSFIPEICQFSSCEFGLAQEFVRPIAQLDKTAPDSLAGCLSVFGTLAEGESAVFQILFKGVVNPWAESIMKASTTSQGKSFFGDDPEMLHLVKEKVSKPLFAVTPRLFVFSETQERAFALNKAINHSLASINRPNSNSLIPVKVGDRDSMEVITDFLLRLSRRTGMIINSGELASMVHIPDISVHSKKLRAYQGKTKAVPKEALGHSFVIGTNYHDDTEQEVSLTTATRLKHTHIIGSTGSGKSKGLLHFIQMDMEEGNGITVLDCHGDLIEQALTLVPERRKKDVVFVDPADADFPIGLNLLYASSEGEKVVLSSDLVSLFKRFSSSWGDVMTSVLSNAIAAFLESPEGGTLIELRRFLTDASFRTTILKKVTDPSITHYWHKEFPLLRANSLAPILTRLDTFLRSKVVRNMMAQKKGLDFHDILNNKKILFLKLSQGLIGEENSFLLGSLMVTKIHQAALHRQKIADGEREPHYLYIDEFQHFVTPSLSGILSGARKYGLGLVVAHQSMEQIRKVDREIANAILTNPATRLCFRLGEEDANELAKGLSYFDATDLQNLSVGQAIVRIERKDGDCNVSIPLVALEPNETLRNEIVENTRAKYATPKEEVEALLAKLLGYDVKESTEQKKEKVKEEEQIKEQAPILVAPTTPIEKYVAYEKEVEKTIAEKGQEFIEKEKAKEEIREHRYVQELIKKLGDAYGFKSTLEEATTDGKGRIDVVLRREDIAIAFEVAITNSKEYELANIKKCIASGFQTVIVCSSNKKHIERISGLYNAEPVKNATVHFFIPEEVSNYIASLLLPKATERIVNGYRVKVSYNQEGNGDRIEKQVVESLLSSFQRKK